MHIGFFSYYGIYNHNRMFIDPSSPIGDDLIYPFVYLGQHLVNKGHKVNTIDMDDLENFDIIMFLEYPTFGNGYFSQLIDQKFKNLYLMIFEPENMKPDNWDRDNHKYFQKVCTWHDDLVDNIKYFKFNFSFKIPTMLDFDLNPKDRLCTMIASNKFNDHPLELYTERRNAIKWFEQNHPEDFDLYGIGWDSSYLSYKGTVKSKNEVLQKYRFSICYENVRNIKGYITEKIFDCFFAGCIPVYLGAPNVTEHIPAETFIDGRNFGSYDELYNYLKSMSDTEYLGYINAIKHFLIGDKIYPFSAQCFTETIVNVLGL